LATICFWQLLLLIFCLFVYFFELLIIIRVLLSPGSHGHVNEAFQLYGRILELGIRPSTNVFNALLQACLASGNTSHVKAILAGMSARFTHNGMCADEAERAGRTAMCLNETTTSLFSAIEMIDPSTSEDIRRYIHG
jgi:hypothetical protein